MRASDDLPTPGTALVLAVLALGLLGAAASTQSPARHALDDAPLRAQGVGACASPKAPLALAPCEDADGDGLSDEDEDVLESDPLDPDSDGDGLHDAIEAVDLGSSPIDPDSDDGGVDDADEAARGTSPTSSEDDGPPLCFDEATGGTRPCT